MAEAVDLSNPDHFNEGVPHGFLRWLRHRDPVHWQEEVVDGGAGFWSITKYDDLIHVSKHPELFSSYLGGTNLFDLPAEDLEGVRALMLNMDPPQHVKFRRIVSRGFTPRRIARLRDSIRNFARQIVDGVAAKGHCELISEVAALLPMMVICEMLGVPEEDRLYVYELSNRLIGFDDPDYQTSLDDARAASAEMYMYAEKLGERARRNPGDDLTSILVHAEVDGEKLSQLEFDSFFLLLALAGNETTRTVTANGIRLLIEHPAERRRILDHPELLPSAIEEIARYCPPLIHFRRTVAEDLRLRDKTLHRGDKVLLWYPSANRDEDVFADPDHFDVGRSPNDHLAFGIGEHYCLGANLARLQLNTIFEELLRRIPDMELAGPPRRLRSNFIDGIKEMPVRFTPEQATRPR